MTSVRWGRSGVLHTAPVSTHLEVTPVTVIPTSRYTKACVYQVSIKNAGRQTLGSTTGLAGYVCDKERQ